MAKGRQYLPFFRWINVGHNVQSCGSFVDFSCRSTPPFKRDKAQGSNRESTPRTGAVAKKDPRGYLEKDPPGVQADPGYRSMEGIGTGTKQSGIHGGDTDRKSRQLHRSVIRKKRGYSWHDHHVGLTSGRWHGTGTGKQERNAGYAGRPSTTLSLLRAQMNRGNLIMCCLFTSVQSWNLI